MNIKDILFSLSGDVSVGHITEAKRLAEKMLSEYAEINASDNLNLTATLKGKSDYKIMLDAHIDQIAMVVTDIDENGFLTVSNAGGIDIRMLPSMRVVVHGKEKIPAVFTATPPHLQKGDEDFSDISKIKLDTALGKKAKEIISVGDYVTFCSAPAELLGGRLSGSSFDDRAAVACLIEVARRLSDKELPVTVVFCLSDGEELGLRGIRPATFKVAPKEAIAVDVSFGDGPGISPDECGKLGDGAMIGISPTLDKEISQKLINTAKENNIPYQTEIMGSTTGTNADMISITKEGVRTCTLSIPLRNMHTPNEILDTKDLESVCDILCEYILSGGVSNA